MKKLKRVLIFLVLFSLIALVACDNVDLNSKQDEDISNKKIIIGTKPMPEGVILGEIFALLIEENTDITPIRKFELGATPILHEAIVNDEIQVYPEYTSTGWLSILKNDPLEDEKELYEKLVSSYQEKFDLSWSPLVGFNNTYTLIANNMIAEDYNLNNMSDLAKVSAELDFGANGDFYEREDGFPKLEKAYGMKFKDTKDINIGLKYQACIENQIQVTTAFTTDGYLSEGKVKILEDDQNIFPNYYAAFVLRQDILDKYPEIQEVLEIIDGLIIDEEMQMMNYQAQIEGKTHEEIAEEFLVDKGLLK